MKIILLTLTLITISCNINYKSLNEDDKLKYKINKYEENLFPKESIFSITPDELKSFVNESDDSLHLIIFYTYWCPSSKLFFNRKIKELLNLKKISLYLINPDDWIEKYSYDNYLKKNEINIPTFTLDVNYYKKNLDIHKKIKIFLDDFLSQNEEYGGFPLILLIDKQFNIKINKTVLCYEESLCDINSNKFYEELLITIK